MNKVGVPPLGGNSCIVRCKESYWGCRPIGLNPRLMAVIPTGMFAMIVLCFGPCRSASAKTAEQTAPATAKDSLDDQLLKDLDQGANDQPPKPAAKPVEAKPAEAKPAAAKPVDPLDEALRKELEGAGEDVNENPITKIAGDMRGVADRLAEQKSDAAMLREQARIAADLAKLLDQLQQQQSQSQSQSDDKQPSQHTSNKKPSQPSQPDSKTGSSPNQNPSDQPARNASTQLRENRSKRPDAESARMLMQKALDRLNLPEKDREQMRSAPPDELLPNYEFSTKKYFERLLEEEK